MAWGCTEEEDQWVYVLLLPFISLLDCFLISYSAPFQPTSSLYCLFFSCVYSCLFSFFLFCVWLLHLASIFHADRPPLYSSTDLPLGFQTCICLCCPVLVPSSKQRANLAWRVMQNQKMRRINVNDETFNLWGSVGFLNNFTSNQVVVQLVSYLLHF